MKANRLVAIMIVSLASLGAWTPSAVLRGYTPLASQRERQTESQFLDIPTAQSALDTTTAIGASTHEAGTAGDYALAVDMRDRLRADGISAELETLTARVDSPRKLLLALAPPADLASPAGHEKHSGRQAAFPIALQLAEMPEASDLATASRAISIPFNPGSADGDVSAPLVYAARGMDSDYDTLAAARVDVHGAIVLVRYGAQFRGLLAQRAQDRGAAAIIFYADPVDDGPTRGRAYPDGPWRPLTAVERGWVGSGIRIPTLPISAANATILLRSLQGSAGPPAWSGALPVGYPLARGPGRVHLIVKLNRRATRLWNTIGVIPGVHGDQNVMLGAHRDAWVYGVGDNGAGITTVLEVARGLGFLLQSGWRPQRTIVIAGWDGEEMGFAGSSAYAQVHRLDTGQACFAYLSADETVTGPIFSAGAAAAFAPLLIDAAQDVPDPLMPPASIYDHWAARAPRGAPEPAVAGGGSDHESLPAQAGTPSVAMRFSGPFGVYHSAYDTIGYAKRWSDPDFSLHRASAQLYGIVLLRLADAGTVPYSLSGYVPLLRQSLARLAAQARAVGLRIDSGPARRAIDRFALAATRFERSSTRRDADETGSLSGLRAVREIDVILYETSGYARTTFPGAADAIAARDGARTEAAIARTGDAVDRASSALAL